MATRYEQQKKIVSLAYSDTKRVWASGLLKTLVGDDVLVEIKESTLTYKIGRLYDWSARCTIFGHFPLNSLVAEEKNLYDLPFGEKPTTGVKNDN